MWHYQFVKTEDGKTGVFEKFPSKRWPWYGWPILIWSREELIKKCEMKIAQWNWKKDSTWKFMLGDLQNNLSVDELDWEMGEEIWVYQWPFAYEIIQDRKKDNTCNGL